ncbi:MAG TPA: BlaI/MecI/CopY family transcriptional regulator [Longimicrobium sp.]|nr:BlaI/MecI/CopY family transcriptional regulator [Longimicrobium sp.]
MNDLPLPTAAELEILRVLWKRGPSTVRAVHEALGESRGTGYTTVLKLMQIMHAKGLVTRNEAERTHVYAAAVQPDRTEGRLVADLAERAFGGSAARLALRALSEEPCSPEELAEVRRLLDALEARGA